MFKEANSILVDREVHARVTAICLSSFFLFTPPFVWSTIFIYLSSCRFICCSSSYLLYLLYFAVESGWSLPKIGAWFWDSWSSCHRGSSTGNSINLMNHWITTGENWLQYASGQLLFSIGYDIFLISCSLGSLLSFVSLITTRMVYQKQSAHLGKLE